MKKKAISVVLLLGLCVLLAVPVFADIGYPEVWVIDRAELLTQSEEDILSQHVSELSRTYQTQILIFTLPEADGWDIDQHIEDIYDESQLGYGDDRSGILLLVCMDIREFRILTNGAANDAIGSWEIDKISDAMVSDMSDGNYYAAFDTFIDQCEYYLDGHINGFPFDWGQNLLIALIIGLVAGLITAFCLKAQLKSVRKQHRADAYVKSGSMQLTHRSDLYLYRNVSRIRKESSSSSGSRSRSGGSRSVGGRSF